MCVYGCMYECGSLKHEGCHRELWAYKHFKVTSICVQMSPQQGIIVYLVWFQGRRYSKKGAC